jgi:hypothetical protein
MRFNRAGWILAALVLSVPQDGQAQQIRSATWSTDKFLLRYWTMVEPPRPQGQELQIGGGGYDDSTTQHRILEDTQQKRYFGYDLQVDAPGNGWFPLKFKPLTVPAATRKFFDIDSGWTEIPIPSVPAVMMVKDGETVALDLLVNPATGEKIVEYINVSSSGRTKTATASGPSKDVQIGDIQMSLMSPKLLVNGKSWEWNRGDSHGAANGAVLWLYVPDKGRFLISFTPHSALGFRQAGEARGSTMKFTWNGENYELQTAGNIVPAEGTWNLYVYQDSGYQPEAHPPVLYGGGDKAEHLLRR